MRKKPNEVRAVHGSACSGQRRWASQDPICSQPSPLGLPSPPPCLLPFHLHLFPPHLINAHQTAPSKKISYPSTLVLTSFMLSAHQKVFSRRIPGLGQCCDPHRTAQGSCRSPAAPQVICKKNLQYFQGNTVILSTRNRKNSLKALTFSTSSVYYSTGLTSKRNQTAWAPQSSPRYPNSHPTILWFYSLQHRGVAYQPTHL